MPTADRRTLLLLIAVVAGAVLVVALALAGGEDDPPPLPPAGSPNVIVVMTDDQTVPDLSVMDHTRDLFARRGVEFDDSIASFPLCCPSRVTFLTGQYAHNHGILSNEESEGGGYANYDDDDSLPITLQAAGYRTGFAGKYLNGYEIEDVPRGWSFWAAKHGALTGYTLNVNGELEEYGSDPSEYGTDVTARSAAGFVEESARGDRPFFLWASFQAPHGERGKRLLDPSPAPRHRGAFAGTRFPKPPSFNELDVSDKPGFVRSSPRLEPAQTRKLELRVRARRESLLAVDEGVQTIVDAVREAGVEDDTYVIFTSDNGYMFGEHRLDKKTALYEESLRVPLLMLGPKVPEGETITAPVANIDLAPTIYDVTGVEPGRVQDGLSLIPTVRRPGSQAKRDILVENAESQGVRAPGWIYLEHNVEDAVEYELYDLARDPYQLENLVDPFLGELMRPDGRAAQELDRLRARLEELRDCQGASCL